MKRFTLCLALLTAGVAVVPYRFSAAQDGKKADKDKKPAPALPRLNVSLASMATAEGPLTKSSFDAASKRPLAVTDPAAAGGIIEGFTFMYAERMMYEDSVGNPLPTVDYNLQYCSGDTLSADVSSEIPFRTKPGDTLFYDQIRIRMPDGKLRWGKGLKYWIVRG